MLVQYPNRQDFSKPSFLNFLFFSLAVKQAIGKPNINILFIRKFKIEGKSDKNDSKLMVHYILCFFKLFAFFVF